MGQIKYTARNVDTGSFNGKRGQLKDQANITVTGRKKGKRNKKLL